jgi:hypothetical protein
MSETFWAIRRREQANRDKVAGEKAAAKASKAALKVEPEVVEEEPSYRDLQATAKELDIPANQSADDLREAIEAAAEDAGGIGVEASVIAEDEG